ncbi:MAG: folate family ECF transporter S component [Oscillospiraceae bacterium]|nr:folate family ECF transporter S component [Oscillospiraceae bacterium]
MKKFGSTLLSSAREIKRLRTLTLCAVLAALAVALNYVASINIGPYIKIGFSGIPNQLVDWLFGPVTGMLFAAVLDVLKFALKPDGVFFFGYTASAMLAAFIYGVSYYKRPLNFWRVLITKAIVAIIVNIGLNTLWLSMQGGKAFFAILPARALKNAIMVPIDSAVFYLIAIALEKAGISKPLRR